MLELKDRLLLNNGISVLSEEQAVRMILSGKEFPPHFRVLYDHDALSYEIVYQEKIHLEDHQLEGIVPFDVSFTEDDIDFVIDRIRTSERYDEQDIDRIEMEMEFFISSHNIQFLISVIDMIDRFRKDRVLWGVGRGSSCASHVLYLLHVHDINPIQFAIPFEEFSKET